MVCEQKPKSEEYFHFPYLDKMLIDDDSCGQFTYPVPQGKWLERFGKIAHDPVKKLISLPPLMVSLGINDGCNYRCIHCFTRNSRKKLINQLKKQDAIALIDNLAKFGVNSLRFFGMGEETIHPYFFEIAAYAKKKGLNTYLLTNGSQIYGNEDKFFNNFNAIRISFDAGDEKYYNYVHGFEIGSKCFQNVVNGISKLCEIKGNGLNPDFLIGTSFVITNVTPTKQIKKYIQLMKNLKVDFIRFKIDNTFQLEQKKLKKFERIINECKKKFKLNSDFVINFSSKKTENIKTNYEKKLKLGCLAQFCRTNIDAEGNVWSCNRSVVKEGHMNKGYLFGNIKDKKFSEIWLGEKRKKYIYDKIEQCSVPCEGCLNKQLKKAGNILINISGEK